MIVGHRPRRQPHIANLVRDRVLFLRRRDENVARLLAHRPVAAHHIGDLRGVAVTADDQITRHLHVRLTGALDRQRIEHPQQIHERPWITVMRSGRRENQRIRSRRQCPDQRIVSCAHVRRIVDLVDHDDVPLHLLQLRPILRLLKSVHRHDHPGEIRERIPARRQLLPHLLNAHRVQAHQRNGEPRPHLLLELLQHMPRSHHENPRTPTAANQLRDDHSDLEGLAQADGVGKQNPCAKPLRI